MKEFVENTNGIYRDIVISENISDLSVKPIIEKICEINYDDSVKEECYKGFKRPPINLYVSSFGGSIYDGFALMDVMQKSVTKIKTIAIGKVMSMGFPIFLTGHEREIRHYATFMYHDATCFVWAKTEEIKQEQKETERIQKIIDDIILSKTKIIETQLRDIKTRKAEWYISAEEAVNYGIGKYESKF